MCTRSSARKKEEILEVFCISAHEGEYFRVRNWRNENDLKIEWGWGVGGIEIRAEVHGV